MGTKQLGSSTILFSKAQRLVLSYLYLNTGKDFNTNEIIRWTNCGRGAVQRELEKLAKVGIINIRQMGNQKRYQANRNLSYYSELQGIIIKTFGLTDILRDKLKPLLLEQIKIAFIYGSFSKQTEKADSDIDLMLIGEDLTYAEVFPFLEEAEGILGRKINPSCYSPHEWVKKYKQGNNFIKQVLEQPKIFLAGTEDELRELE